MSLKGCLNLDFFRCSALCISNSNSTHANCCYHTCIKKVATQVFHWILDCILPFFVLFFSWS